MMKYLLEALAYLPEPVKTCILRHPQAKHVEELRLRRGQPVTCTVRGVEIPFPVQAGEELMQVMIDRATERSPHAVMNMLCEGYLILPGGHRMGICGTGVYREGKLRTMRDISSLSIRVAREIHGVADGAVGEVMTRGSSVLCIGPPGCGKTTFLRDLIRQLGSLYHQRIAVVDERRELGACIGGVPQFDLGPSTDILSSVGKAEGIEMLLRSMSPQWIALDEITAMRDVRAMVQASYCGVRFLATAHAESFEDLKARPVYQSLLREKVFRLLLCLNREKELLPMELSA
ncbi:MAG: Flp pilus assembly complex ATPase component TadA [Oscillospiraceae bacterium]|nr:Flp pilus assembly complex ATPase component TadA [Oscillospiraceae bacterium]